MSSRFSKMKVAELKEECSKRQLATSGSKDKLISRLLENEPSGDSEGSGEDDDLENEDDEEEDKLPEDLGTLKVPELKAALKKRGLPAGGNKKDLLERLEAFINGGVIPEKKTTKRKSEDEESKRTTKKVKSEIEDGNITVSSNKILNESDDGSISAVASGDFSFPPKLGNELKMVSWNVAGFNAVMKKGFKDYMKQESPDMICLNETKIKSIPEDKFPGYFVYTNAAQKPGYSGVGLLTKIKPISVTMGIGIAAHDTEGRVITAEYNEFYLVVSYIPNSGAKGDDGWPKDLNYRMEWDVAFQAYLQGLDKVKPIIWCGDLNVAHTEIDLAKPSNNKKTAGFTPKERESFDKFLRTGFVDVHRRLNPSKKGLFSFWSYRSKGGRENNIGWRLDYFIVSERLFPSISQSFFRTSVLGSDHCPICIHYKTAATQ